PQNKPLGEEVKKCNQFLLEEIQMLPRGGVLVALGAVAHSAILKALQLKQAQFAFGHGCVHQVDSGITMIDSYHCSRYNTQTRRLTSEMFGDVFVTARKLLNPT
ncbi:MAG: uracil-DNA glycosylase, partial [Betaproteobacteria bacterium]|nr:uracil-DNA glycosylase [Betaproteobacteria bacterium]